jgi:hypothetical protein
MPSGRTPSESKLISLDFKDADILNLLRILSAESGRNIGRRRVGQGIRLATQCDLEQRSTPSSRHGLQRLERNGIIRAVCTDQLTKEREAQARCRMLSSAESDARTRRADAEFKEPRPPKKFRPTRPSRNCARPSL